VVTLDAMNETQMAAEIQQAEGDYVLALKGKGETQPTSRKFLSRLKPRTGRN